MTVQRIDMTRIRRLTVSIMLLVTGAGAVADENTVPALDVKALVLKTEDLRAALAGNTVVQKGIWPFAFYLDPSGKYEGWYAEDKAGNEAGTDRVPDSGPWDVKDNQVCMSFSLEGGGTQVDCRYMVRIGEQVLVFDPKGSLLYPDVRIETGKRL